MIQSIEFVTQLLLTARLTGLVISFIVLIYLLKQETASPASHAYALGSLGVMFLSGSTIVGESTIMWGNVIGLIGGYVLIVLALVQFWFDRKNRNSKGA